MLVSQLTYACHTNLFFKGFSSPLSGYLGVILIWDRVFSCSVAVLNESLALQATRLYSSGATYGGVSEELEISKGRVGDLIREGIKIIENNNVDPDGAPVVQVEAEQENKDELLPTEFSDYKDLDGLMTQTLLIHATPILKKVALNSKVFLQHEYFQKQLGYEGDVGDLLVEALNFYWTEMGFKITISQDSVM